MLTFVIYVTSRFVDAKDSLECIYNENMIFNESLPGLEPRKTNVKTFDMKTLGGQYNLSRFIFTFRLREPQHRKRSSDS